MKKLGIGPRQLSSLSKRLGPPPIFFTLVSFPSSLWYLHWDQEYMHIYSCKKTEKRRRKKTKENKYLCKKTEENKHKKVSLVCLDTYNLNDVLQVRYAEEHVTGSGLFICFPKASAYFDFSHAKFISAQFPLKSRNMYYYIHSSSIEGHLSELLRNFLQRFNSFIF